MREVQKQQSVHRIAAAKKSIYIKDLRCIELFNNKLLSRGHMRNWQRGKKVLFLYTFMCYNSSSSFSDFNLTPTLHALHLSVARKYRFTLFFPQQMHSTLNRSHAGESLLCIIVIQVIFEIIEEVLLFAQTQKENPRIQFKFLIRHS